MKSIRVVNRTRNTTVGDNIELADTSLTRMWGLLGRQGLGTGEGLGITPSSGVHTLGMRFSIDVIGLDRHRRVVKLWPDLVPYRLTSVNLKIASVIELAAGGIRHAQVELATNSSSMFLSETDSVTTVPPSQRHSALHHYFASWWLRISSIHRMTAQHKQ